MKSLPLLLLLLASTTTLAQTKDYSKDVASPDAIIAAVYDVISGGPGVARDWERFRYLFRPETRLIPTRKSPQGDLVTQAMSPEEYVTAFASRVPTGFFEKEVHRVQEQYGTVTHAFSTYEAREKTDGPIIAKGINSIQLFYDGKRYYIVTIFWCAEAMGFPLPEKYLAK
ncbi:MAG TPA: hypothetical protein VFE50_03160 [Cyclobacteriaceae bacterium]|nr:hypothetical protein [Cyclobacteriaceae bacterium]